MTKGGRNQVILLALVFFVSCTASVSSEKQESRKRDGLQDLFDGESLSGWESTRFGGEGSVRVKDGTIILGSGDSLTGITWKEAFPETDYEVSLDAQRVRGSDFFCGLTFPVGGSFCSLIVGGWGGSVIGISSVDGLDASENETNRLKRFENGHWYKVRVRVASSKIVAWIDTEQIIDLVTRERQLNVRPEVRLSRPFGIAAWQTTAALKNIRLKYPITHSP